MGSLISSLTGSAKKARKAQERAAAIANKKLAEARDINIGAIQPQIDYGSEGMNQLMMRLGIGEDETNPLFGSLLDTFTGEDLAATPGYQFGLEQGQLALDRQAASRGGLISGAALKGAQRFGQDYAGTKFQEGYNRDATDKGRIASFLGNVSNMGISAIDKANLMRTDVANQRAQNALGVGNAYAAQHMAQGAGWDSVLNTGVSAALAGATMGMGGLGGFGAAAPATTGGMASQGAMGGFSQNLLNPNFAKNYMGLG